MLANCCRRLSVILTASSVMILMPSLYGAGLPPCRGDALPASIVLECVDDADSLYRLGSALMPTNSVQDQQSQPCNEKRHFFGYGFVRGVGNIVTSPLEVPRCLLSERESGFLTGIDRTAGRFFNGIMETITFGQVGGGIYDAVIWQDWVWDDSWRPRLERTKDDKVSEDSTKALMSVPFIEKAANKGHGRAQHLLGIMCLKGIIDGKPDYDKAVKWLERAVFNGDGTAKPDLIRARGF